MQGFYKKDELQLLINRRTSIREITSATINKAIEELDQNLKQVETELLDAFKELENSNNF